MLEHREEIKEREWASMFGKFVDIQAEKDFKKTERTFRSI